MIIAGMSMAVFLNLSQEQVTWEKLLKNLKTNISEWATRAKKTKLQFKRGWKIFRPNQIFVKEIRNFYSQAFQVNQLETLEEVWFS